MGQEPRKFDAMRAQVLSNLAEMLVRQLEYNWALQLQEQQTGVRMLRAMSCYDKAYLFVETSGYPWRVWHMNVPAINQLGRYFLSKVVGSMFATCMQYHVMVIVMVTA